MTRCPPENQLNKFRGSEKYRLVSSRPDIALMMIDSLAKLAFQAHEFTVSIVTEPIVVRLTNQLLALAGPSANPSDTLKRTLGRVSQDQLATMIATTRESVNKHLASLRNIGLLSIDRGVITIENTEKLKKVVTERARKKGLKSPLDNIKTVM